MTDRRIIGGPVTGPGGALLPGTEIRLTLVRADRPYTPVQGIDAPTGRIVIGAYVETADQEAMVDFLLWPNDRGHSQTVYLIEFPGTGIRPLRAVVPESEADLDWLEFITGGEPLSPSEITALEAHTADDDRHVPLAAANPDGSLLGLSAGSPAWTAAPPGSGDMQSLVYDPTGVADDAFDAGNLVGNIDCGTF